MCFDSIITTMILLITGFAVCFSPEIPTLIFKVEIKSKFNSD